eukprot:CAMPEP_0172564406 /NCGR_PEP_ID=MMETSP1067-20121228/104213_1 /TAXON_ID=265564 ORGANISM="Thalassiosira punctigera, Strain Tpunct2005C2" /NCGR_SAMPLE_ID=MMETSP1067 /ASSEMBLY_ACC=CAM_ASM_000444 /LENGTH=230 /DNA_ID=CAMNT_0013355065 /DNA_START=374 /DNA_END=1067 /DNA_ORIENTATION=-
MFRYVTLHIDEHPAHVLVRVDDVCLSIGEGAEAGYGEGRSVGLGDLAPFIGQHEVIQPLARAKLRILRDAVHGNADDLRVPLPKRLQILLEPPRLDGAPAGERPGIEVEHGPLAPVGRQGVERDGLSAGVGERKFGGGGAQAGTGDAALAGRGRVVDARVMAAADVAAAVLRPKKARLPIGLRTSLEVRGEILELGAFFCRNVPSIAFEETTSEGEARGEMGAALGEIGV